MLCNEQLFEDNTKQESKLGVKRTQRDSYVRKILFEKILVNLLKSKLFGQNDETHYAKIERMDSDINDAVLHCQNDDIRVQ
jgi:hypothetical protein